MNLILKLSFAFLLVLFANTVVTEPIITAPFTAIPLGKVGNYTCQCDVGQFVQWLVRVPGMATLSLAPGGSSLISSTLSYYGISMSMTSPWILAVNASMQNNGTVLKCTSFTDKAVLSQSLVVTVFDRPDTPRALNTIAIAQGILELVWVPSFSLPGVNTTYTILVADLPIQTMSQTIGPILEPHYAYTFSSLLGALPISCHQYQFTVFAKNDAGKSDPSQPVVSSFPAVPLAWTPRSKVTSNDVDDFTITLTFNAAKTCEEFPVEGYYVDVVDDITGDNLVEQLALYNTSTNASDIQVVLHTSDGLQPNVRYICSILAYNTIGMSTPSSIVVYTTDVQSSTITGSDHQLNVTCFFAEGTQARGCAVCLEKSGEVVYQMVPRVNKTAKGVIRTEFSVDCYNISVVDWEENGSIGSLAVPLNITKVPSPMMLCSQVVSGTQMIQHLASIFTGVVGGAVVLLAAVIVVVIVERHKSRSKRKFKIRQDKVESFCTSPESSATIHCSLSSKRVADRHSSRDNSTPMSSSTPMTAQSLLSVCSEGGTLV